MKNYKFINNIYFKIKIKFKEKQITDSYLEVQNLYLHFKFFI